MATAVVLYGPKAAGKSWAADVLRSRLGVHHIDADPLVLELIARGVGPDPREGWMAWVEHAAAEALRRHRAVSVEATGAWDSDWELSRRLEAAGARVIRVWIWAPEEETIERLARRTKNAAPITEAEARRIHAEATARASSEGFDVEIDTSGVQDPDSVVAMISPLLDE